MRASAGAGSGNEGNEAGFSGVGGGGVLEPWASSGFLGKSSEKFRENLELAAKSWESSAGKFWDFCIIRRIIHRCGISVT